LVLRPRFDNYDSLSDARRVTRPFNGRFASDLVYFYGLTLASPIPALFVKLWFSRLLDSMGVLPQPPKLSATFSPVRDVFLSLGQPRQPLFIRSLLSSPSLSLEAPPTHFAGKLTLQPSLRYNAARSVPRALMGCAPLSFSEHFFLGHVLPLPLTLRGKAALCPGRVDYVRRRVSQLRSTGRSSLFSCFWPELRFILHSLPPCLSSLSYKTSPSTGFKFAASTLTDVVTRFFGADCVRSFTLFSIQSSCFAFC